MMCLKAWGLHHLGLLGAIMNDVTGQKVKHDRFKMSQRPGLWLQPMPMSLCILHSAAKTVGSHYRTAPPSSSKSGPVGSTGHYNGPFRQIPHGYRPRSQPVSLEIYQRLYSRAFVQAAGYDVERRCTDKQHVCSIHVLSKRGLTR